MGNARASLIIHKINRVNDLTRDVIYSKLYRGGVSMFLGKVAQANAR